VMRQTGEAWNRPFVNVIAPTDSKHTTTIQSVEELPTPGAPDGFVNLAVKHTDGSSETIFSDVTGRVPVRCGATTVQATYALEESKPDGAQMLLLGDGLLLHGNDGVTLQLAHEGSALYRREGKNVLLSLSGDGLLTVPAEYTHEANLVVEVHGEADLHFTAQKITKANKTVDVYRLPSLPLSSAHFE